MYGCSEVREKTAESKVELSREKSESSKCEGDPSGDSKYRLCQGQQENTLAMQRDTMKGMLDQTLRQMDVISQAIEHNTTDRKSRYEAGAPNAHPTDRN